MRVDKILIKKQMKKLLLPVAVLAMVSISCSKECECETKVNGEVISTEVVEIEDGKCKDMNTEVSMMGMTSSVECK